MPATQRSSHTRHRVWRGNSKVIRLFQSFPAKYTHQPSAHCKRCREKRIRPSAIHDEFTQRKRHQREARPPSKSAGSTTTPWNSQLGRESASSRGRRGNHCTETSCPARIQIASEQPTNTRKFLEKLIFF